MPLVRYCLPCGDARGWPESQRKKETACTLCGTTGVLCSIGDSASLPTTEAPTLKTEASPTEPNTHQKKNRKARTAAHSKESVCKALFGLDAENIKAADMESLSIPTTDSVRPAVRDILDHVILGLSLEMLSDNRQACISLPLDTSTIVDVFSAVAILKKNGFLVTPGTTHPKTLNISRPAKGI